VRSRVRSRVRKKHSINFNTSGTFSVLNLAWVLVILVFVSLVLYYFLVLFWECTPLEAMSARAVLRKVRIIAWDEELRAADL
jgi:hypothetical protein